MLFFLYSFHREHSLLKLKCEPWRGVGGGGVGGGEGPDSSGKLESY